MRSKIHVAKNLKKEENYSNIKRIKVQPWQIATIVGL
jgi:hypothetical protein